MLARINSPELSDGTLAVGLFNRSRKNAIVTAQWRDLGLIGALPVRDLWQRKDVGMFTDKYSAEVPRHGAVMVKVGKPKE